MTARAVNCVVIVCNGCGVEHEFEDDRPNHWPSRKEAAKCEREADGRWEIPADTEGPDLCPDCVCKRDGHQMGEWISGTVRAIRFCDHCTHSEITVGVPS